MGIKSANGKLLINPLGVFINDSDQVLVLRDFKNQYFL